MRCGSQKVNGGVRDSFFRTEVQGRRTVHESGRSSLARDEQFRSFEPTNSSIPEGIMRRLHIAFGIAVSITSLSATAD